MKFRLFFCFFLLLSLSSYSQTITVLDKSNSKPISYVTVQLIQDHKIIGGDYTDNSGLVNFNKTIFTEIRLSCIGYKTKFLNFQDISNTVLLEPDTIALNEVIVKNNVDSDFNNINFINEISKPSMGFGKGYEIGVFIENKEQKVKDIHSVVFKIHNYKRKTTENRYFRIHFYNKSIESDLPGKEILIDNMIYFIKPDVTGLTAFDISKYNIQLPLDGLFVSIENLGFLNSNKDDFMNFHEVIGFEATDIELNKLTYVRSIFNNYIWYDFSEKFIKIHSIKRNSKKKYNFMIGLKVYK